MNYLKYMIIGLVFIPNLFAKDLPGSRDWKVNFSPKVTSDGPAYSLINIGNFGYWQKDDAESAHSPGGSSGGIYPRGTAGAIYLDGVLVGGYTGGNLLHVSGTIYANGLVSGYIGEDGNMVTGGDVRIYRIRKDWASLSLDQLRQDAAEVYETSIGSVTDAQIQTVLDQYETDWENWPTHLGAPFYDLDGNGIYEPDAGETPGLAGADQVIWYVATDADVGTTSALYGTTPIGVEIQYTLWGYNQPGASLGQIIFKNVRLLNKGSADLTEAYISLWSDPDLGDYGDDFVGVDTSLSLMFAYNGAPEDQDYAAFGLAPAAVGYDFFAGPIVPSAGDTAIFNLKKRPGFKNLPASSFGYFIAGGVYSDPGPYGNTEAAREYYNLMRGYAPTDDLENPTPWIDQSTGLETLFPYAGDPVTGVGDLDSGPADRRMLINAGPFTLAVGDTQDIVTAIVGGLGDTQLSSITDMKFSDDVAQLLFDDLFQSVPAAPAPPQVNVSTTESSVILNWGTDEAAIDATEETVTAGYAFEGYNIYQLPSATAALEDGIKLATFDLENGVTQILGNVFLPEYGTQVSVPVQNGLDVGVKRYLVITDDLLAGGPLYPGSEYYFAVTAYNYNAEPALIEDKTLESAPSAIIVTVQSPSPGVRYGADAGSDLTFTKTGASDGQIAGLVVDPSSTTGDTYTVGFAVSEDTSWTEAIWYLQNSAGVKVLDDQAQLGDLSDYDDQLIVDGVKIKVAGPAAGMNFGKFGVAYGDGSGTSATYLQGWDFTGDRWLGGTDWGGGGLFGGLDNGFNFFGSTLVEGTDFFDVQMLWAGCAGCTDGMTARQMADQSMSETPELWSKAVVQRRDLGYETQADLADVPFAVYNTETTPPTRLQVAIVETDAAGSGNLLWDMGMGGIGGDTTMVGYGGREYTFMSARSYDYDGDGTGGTLADYADYLPGGTSDAVYDDILYAFWPATRGSRAYLHAEFTLSIFASNINLIGEDSWNFTAPAVTTTAADKATDYAKINVFPNPYYAYNPQESNRFDKFVTFTHLPNTATIKLYTIDGTMVRKLEKDDTDQFMKWDLRNSNNLPVASGPYIALIESADMEESKTLKVYVIQRNQVVQYY
jgi:hypothetical protein